MTEGTAASELLMPILCAVSTVLCGPTSTESWAYTTLSEIVVAAATLSIPPGPSPFTTHGGAYEPMGMTQGLLEG